MQYTTVFRVVAAVWSRAQLCLPKTFPLLLQPALLLLQEGEGGVQLLILHQALLQGLSSL